MDAPKQLNQCQRNPSSFNDALHQVDRNLVYDPITKKLCLKTVFTNIPFPNQAYFSEYDDCSKSKSYPKTSHSSFELDLSNNNNFGDISDKNVNSSNLLSTNRSDDDSKIRNNLIKDIAKLNLSQCRHDFNFSNGYETFSNNVNIFSLKRPDNLPPKSKNEERKHRAQFLEILQHAKTKDLKQKKLRKDSTSKQVQQEYEIQKAIKIWTNEILPCWASSHITKRVQDLWWHGIPSPIRPKVWNLVIGNDLHITEQLFHICVNRSKEKIWTKQFSSRRSSNPTSIGHEYIKTHRRASSHSFDSYKSKNVETITDVCCPQSINQNIKFEIAKENDDDDEHSENIAFLIKMDVLRTFPQLGLFQETGPYHKSLCDVLSAYVVYRPDIGYCQGMSFLAAMLLLNSQSSSSAFTSLANLLNNELLLAFYALNQDKMRIIYSYYDRQFYSLLPNLAHHFAKIGLTTDLFFMFQVYTIFARSLSLDCVSRVWDLFLRDGNEFIFRASLGILSMYQKKLIQLEFIDSARFLSNLPDDMDTDKYFETIASIKLIPPKLSTMMADNRKVPVDNQNKSRYPSFVHKFLRF